MPGESIGRWRAAVSARFWIVIAPRSVFACVTINQAEADTAANVIPARVTDTVTLPIIGMYEAPASAARKSNYRVMVTMRSSKGYNFVEIR